MLKEFRKEDKYDDVLNKVLENIEKSGFESIKADFPEMEKPARLVGQSNEDIFIPDATALTKTGSKAYFEISRKVDEPQKLVNKWKLLSTLAELKNGVFKIFVPHGAMRFTREIVNRYNIKADLVKI
jgi:hypothetical protein